MADSVHSNGSNAWSAREIARRLEDAAGRPLSPVMQAAVTARELAHAPVRKK